MEHSTEKSDDRRDGHRQQELEVSPSLSCLLTLPLGESVSTFSLENAVCSHGLFMMAPNQWDPSTKTFQRPLRLSDETTSILVRISHPPNSPSLHVRVLGTAFLSPDDQRVLLAQVTRMLRLSDSDERNIREFHKIHHEAKERGFGRVFRSPTLFEDMVKCILLCNCQWPRTLAMAKALFELQSDLKCNSLGCSDSQGSSLDSRCSKAKYEDFFPKTPIGRDSKKRRAVHKISLNLDSKFKKAENELEADVYGKTNSDHPTQCLQLKEKISATLASPLEGDESQEHCCYNKQLCTKVKVDANPALDLQFSEDKVSGTNGKIGNFPNPREIAGLNEALLAKRCNLGYRASRILKLAQSIVQGKLQLRELEEDCNGESSSLYAMLFNKFREIDGFGPFTCANVLMCMGFYEMIPVDSETIRHLKQVHARQSTIQSVHRDVEKIYGGYAPFQFLAYWSELWHFYGARFGKLSEMLPSEYHLITASNMRTKRTNKKNI
ncbi:PREDICTED: uncharacterized protein LOC104593879 [Nelumbo nucifera]|uniref:HhH-GPD domain-containing protein n=2 Tax=Nelumbo nucifera TaxID=4432 RepID=A0A822Z1B0_NELNU|nr:PREDICTED: uncharacterized protein LOC104593879 [Nelumbo nucifera]DAD38782.1 TPA_asm: hypothetical protein HUJ06_013104 [Nelumbo nucifera]